MSELFTKEQAIAYAKQHAIEFAKDLQEYESSSGTMIVHDERPMEELYNIFITESDPEPTKLVKEIPYSSLDEFMNLWRKYFGMYYEDKITPDKLCDLLLTLIGIPKEVSHPFIFSSGFYSQHSQCEQKNEIILPIVDSSANEILHWHITEWIKKNPHCTFEDVPGNVLMAAMEEYKKQPTLTVISESEIRLSRPMFMNAADCMVNYQESKKGQFLLEKDYKEAINFAFNWFHNHIKAIENINWQNIENELAAYMGSLPAPFQGQNKAAKIITDWFKYNYPSSLTQ